MIGKIMSEASHSIIGMVSAKPLDMETRTANNEFSSLLLPSEDRSLPAVKNGVAETADESRSDEFLQQLMGYDAQPVPATNQTIGFGIIAANISANSDAGDIETPSDLPPATKAASDLESFSKTLKAPAAELAGDDTEHKLADGANASNTSKLSQVADKLSTIFANPQADRKTATENAEKLVDANIPTNGLAKQVPGIDMPVTAKPRSDVEMADPSKDIGLSAKMPMASETMQDEGYQRKLRDTLELRLASQGKVEPTGSSIAPKFDLGEVMASADKPMTIDVKSSLPKADNLTVPTQLESDGETTVPVPSAPVNGGQAVTAKTVSLDGSAPQFAERFAAEIRDLSVTGDLKKFEINGKNMGRLEVSLISRGSSEIVRIEADSEATREMIMQHSSAIQDMLKVQGRADLALRVDVRENMFAASQNNGMNFGQESSADARDEGSLPSQNRGGTMPTESDADLGPPSDNSRYA
ncbi:MAG: hypothetical protein V7676_01785 [Parasphingorhabdus sp.]|uniref:hypothetical protein n=1 Tax=Parasphingorhabdus sp. TaxID=2709688 RepID=UPI003002AF39